MAVMHQRCRVEAAREFSNGSTQNDAWAGHWVGDCLCGPDLIALLSNRHQQSRLDRLVDTQATGFRVRGWRVRARKNASIVLLSAKDAVEGILPDRGLDSRTSTQAKLPV